MRLQVRSTAIWPIFEFSGYYAIHHTDHGRSSDIAGFCGVFVVVVSVNNMLLLTYFLIQESANLR